MIEIKLSNSVEDLLNDYFILMARAVRAKEYELGIYNPELDKLKDKLPVQNGTNVTRCDKCDNFSAEKEPCEAKVENEMIDPFDSNRHNSTATVEAKEEEEAPKPKKATKKKVTKVEEPIKVEELEEPVEIEEPKMPDKDLTKLVKEKAVLVANIDKKLLKEIFTKHGVARMSELTDYDTKLLVLEDFKKALGE